MAPARFINHAVLNGNVIIPAAVVDGKAFRASITAVFDAVADAVQRNMVSQDGETGFAGAELMLKIHIGRNVPAGVGEISRKTSQTGGIEGNGIFHGVKTSKRTSRSNAVRARLKNFSSSGSIV